MASIGKGFEITYYGHSTFRIKSPERKIIFIDPWINENPSCPDDLKEVDGVDIIAVTHGHFDHISDVRPLAEKFKPTIVSNWEICDWLGAKNVENCAPMNKGGGQSVDGIKFIMTHAQHSSGIKDDDGKTVYGGE
nr:MBL fold metallo-hydrolase [Candidatus Dadabacteria bacterium]NIS09941.1 MBL fold metallo-hydrolase [Candidatus Dadabacteria bacterium]NIY22559.1 MBL fold metallo-hydrolase [Candidatus Dadabacteria bacterium]